VLVIELKLCLQHPHMLDRLHHGAINMHPSLLPKVFCSLMLLLR